jgi:hypothetical protein
VPEVKNMSGWLRTGRFRSNEKRLRRICYSASDLWWVMALLVLVMLLSVAAGGWLAYIYSD